MTIKRFFMLFMLTVIIFQSQFSEGSQSLLTSNQINTLSNNYMLMAGYVDLLKNLTSDQPLEEVPFDNDEVIDKHLLVNKSINEIQYLTIYEIEATDLYLMISDEQKAQVLIFRKLNLKILRDKTKAILEMIQNDYVFIGNNEIVTLYDNANQLLQPLLYAFDENLAVYNSIK